MTITKLSPIACSLSLLMASSTTTAFSPATSFGRHHNAVTSPALGPLHVSVVSQFVSASVDERATAAENDEKLRSTFEKETPESVGMNDEGIQQKLKPAPVATTAASTKTRRRKQQRAKRKHNYSTNADFLNQSPDLDFYTLHSSAVSHLHKDMPIDDIVRAIKRAQNRHDAHDLKTIASFLIDACDETWGYGFRGSLLSRLAVAALHLKDTATAHRAIETRRKDERESMQPHESAAIVRGLMRVQNIEEGWDVLEDELSLPTDGASVQTSHGKELLKHRARSLASIASRHFFEGEPFIAAQALHKITLLGDKIYESGMNDEVEMPWARLVNAASECNNYAMPGGSYPCKYIDDDIELPSDLTDLVWDTMVSFPCPGEEEECAIDDYLLEP
eukprot:CAMPEP_0119556390 /NCGR_PEP_ID=MMETSP1352-20130426/8372_1 /TAXON_ID=265584 /ORGANISM="Stauroneis constricta, Strain CCMP1120" /LENGTH=390 /DNA_ID=CAMNT_0007603351 /DNA_START=146 /DNA_END=1318 /DNA_ORIENTATION=+